MTTHHDTVMIPPVAPVNADAHAHYATTQIDFFAHRVHNKANLIRFAHQSLCSPQVSTLVKAIQCGYLKGFPNLTVKGVLKFFNPSPATAKGHMRQPRKGICSTRRNIPLISETDTNPITVAYTPSNATLTNNESIDSPHIAPRSTHTNLIKDDNKLEAIIFCFTTFAYNMTGVLYSNFMGTFSFMSLK